MYVPDIAGCPVYELSGERADTVQTCNLHVYLDLFGSLHEEWNAA